MPEEQVLGTSQTQQTPEPQSQIPQEVHELMQLSLGHVKMGDDIHKEQVSATQADGTSTETTQEQSQEQVVQQASEFSFDIFKDKFGYQKPEDAIKEIEELRLFKSSPAAEVEFENEDSEKLFKAIQKGDRKTVASILSQQERLEQYIQAEVTEDTASDIIKMGMQLKYKDLSHSEIDYRFNKQFGLPKEPVQRLDELEEDFLERKAEWEERVNDIKINKIIEAKLMKPELQAAKAQIKLPEIHSDIDEGYVEYQNMLTQSQQLRDEAVKDYKSFTPKSIEIKVPFIDEKNKIQLDFQFEPDGESFNKVVDMISDTEKLFGNFKNQDGTPDRKGFLKAMYFGLNMDKIIIAAINQSKNATLKSQLPDNSNSGIQRQFPQTQETSELDKLMKMSLNGYGRS